MEPEKLFKFARGSGMLTRAGLALAVVSLGLEKAWRELPVDLLSGAPRTALESARVAIWPVLGVAFGLILAGVILDCLGRNAPVGERWLAYRLWWLGFTWEEIRLCQPVAFHRVSGAFTSRHDARLFFRDRKVRRHLNSEYARVVGRKPPPSIERRQTFDPDGLTNYGIRLHQARNAGEWDRVAAIIRDELWWSEEAVLNRKTQNGVG